MILLGFRRSKKVTGHACAQRMHARAQRMIVIEEIKSIRIPCKRNAHTKKKIITVFYAKPSFAYFSRSLKFYVVKPKLCSAQPPLVFERTQVSFVCYPRRKDNNYVKPKKRENEKVCFYTKSIGHKKHRIHVSLQKPTHRLLLKSKILMKYAQLG